MNQEQIERINQHTAEDTQELAAVDGVNVKIWRTKSGQYCIERKFADCRAQQLGPGRGKKNLGAKDVKQILDDLLNYDVLPQLGIPAPPPDDALVYGAEGDFDLLAGIPAQVEPLKKTPTEQTEQSTPASIPEQPATDEQTAELNVWNNLLSKYHK